MPFLQELTSNNDLSLEKKIVQLQLLKNKTSIELLTNILNEKKLKKSLLSSASLNFNTQQQSALKNSSSIVLSDYCIPKRRCKALPQLKASGSNDATPAPVTSPNILSLRQAQAKRLIGNKTIKSLEKVIVEKKEIIKIKKERSVRKFPDLKIPISMLPNRYIRGELPCTIEHGINGHYLGWACPLDQLDYDYYLPIFFDGLQCNEHPISFLACQGIEDLLLASKGYPERVISCIPLLTRPLRNALNKFDVEVLLHVLKAIQLLVLSNKEIGPVLMKYGKQFISPMAVFMGDSKNIGDSIDYSQRKSNDVGEEVRKTLELIEEYGGPNAFESIKFSVPLYQSCIRPPDLHHRKHIAAAGSNKKY